MPSQNNADCHDFPINTLVNFQDNSIFEILYEKYWEPLLTFAGKYISDKDTCKEIVQELFIMLHLKGRQLTINVSLTSYLYMSVRNKILNYLRNESIYKKHLAVAGKAIHGLTPRNDIDQLMDVNDLEKEIFLCLNKMPARYKEVYMLNKQQAYSLKKTAEILHRPVDTVEKQLREVLRQVQAHLNRCYVLP